MKVTTLTFVVVLYMPYGKRVVALLRGYGIQPTVLACASSMCFRHRQQSCNFIHNAVHMLVTQVVAEHTAINSSAKHVMVNVCSGSKENSVAATNTMDSKQKRRCGYFHLLLPCYSHCWHASLFLHPFNFQETRNLQGHLLYCQNTVSVQSSTCSKAKYYFQRRPGLRVPRCFPLRRFHSNVWRQGAPHI